MCVVSYAPWCPACKSLIPTWDKLGQRSFDLDMNFAKVDVTANAGYLHFTVHYLYLESEVGSFFEELLEIY